MVTNSFNSSSLSLREKVGQLFFIALPGEEFDLETRKIIEEIRPGGVCLFARNTKNADKTRKLLNDIRDALPFEPFLSLDQEGGLVDRLRRIVEPMPSAKDISKSGSIENVRKFAEISAEIIRILGFNTNFAPVVDITDETRKDCIMDVQSRTFGSSCNDVVKFTTEYLTTLQNGGVIGCLKHFPGIGAVKFDPHEELPKISLSREELFEHDLIPYIEHFQKNDVFAVMTGHTTFPLFDLQESDSNDKLLPSSLSRKIVTTLLRDELGFDNLALTDDLEMGAIINSYGIGEASKMAFEAGNDFILICNDPKSVFEGFHAILNAAKNGEISESRIDESLTRISRVRSHLKPPLEFNERRLEELSDKIKDLKKSI